MLYFSWICLFFQKEITEIFSEENIASYVKDIRNILFQEDNTAFPDQDAYSSEEQIKLSKAKLHQAIIDFVPSKL